MSTYAEAEACNLTKPAIQRLAESVAVQLEFSPGDDIYDLVSRTGGCVRIEDTLLSDPEETGSLYVDGPNQYRILVPSHTSPERDRFTIAHEFGHYVLHYLWKRQNDPTYPLKVKALRKGSKRIEWEANWFAAAFLMPADVFRAAHARLAGDYWAIAREFKVSTKAAEVRSEDLGLV